MIACLGASLYQAAHYTPLTVEPAPIPPCTPMRQPITAFTVPGALEPTVDELLTQNAPVALIETYIVLILIQRQDEYTLYRQNDPYYLDSSSAS
jgi:hypothetical protein